MTADVRNVEKVEAFRFSTVQYRQKLQQIVDQTLASTSRIERWIEDDVPRYWQRELGLAERRLNEANDRWSQLTSAVRPGDPPSATEARMEVRQCRDRLALCQQRVSQIRRMGIEIHHEIDKLRGVMGGVGQIVETDLPAANASLQELLRHLNRYLS